MLAQAVPPLMLPPYSVPCPSSPYGCLFGGGSTDRSPLFLFESLKQQMKRTLYILLYSRVKYAVGPYMKRDEEVNSEEKA